MSATVDTAMPTRRVLFDVSPMVEGLARDFIRTAYEIALLAFGRAPSEEELPGDSPPIKKPPPEANPEGVEVLPGAGRRARNALAAKEYRQRRKAGLPNPKRQKRRTPPQAPVPPQEYTSQAGSSTPHVQQPTIDGSGAGEVRHRADDAVMTVDDALMTRHHSSMTHRGCQRVFPEEIFNPGASEKPTARTPAAARASALAPPPLAPPHPSQSPGAAVVSTATGRSQAPACAPRRAPQSLAAHAVRERTPKPDKRPARASSPPSSLADDASSPDDANGSRGGGSAVTPDGRVAPGYNLRDAMCALFAEVMKGKRYDWRDEDDKAVRALLVRAGNDTDEMLLRWRIALRTRYPRCRSVRKLLQEWNEYAAPDLEPDAPQQPVHGLDVGRSTARECDCAVRGCGGPGVPAWGQSLCVVHFDAMAKDIGSGGLSNDAAAAWLEGQNAMEVAS